MNIYHIDRIISFRKTKEEYGGLSNMCAGFELLINDVPILTSEAMYQACRLPHLPEVQKEIIKQKSPMAAKMVGKPHKQNTRDDWDNVNVKIMGWCLRAKLAQNFLKFGQLLESTNGKQILEDSHKDDFWGAIKDKANPKVFKGQNKLGKLLTRLRDLYNSEDRYSLLSLEPLDIPDFLLYSEPIKTLNETEKFSRMITSTKNKNNIQAKKNSDEDQSFLGEQTTFFD